MLNAPVGSRPITEGKQHRAWLVLGWETAWEHQVLYFFCLKCGLTSVTVLQNV